MQRPIVGYRKDEEDYWVALLNCGHPRHVRHDPPLVSRPWVLSEEGRKGQMGMMLTCVRCDRQELPPHFEPYRRTPEFTQDSVPAALRDDHSTAAGVWARIHVSEGRLRYRAESLGVDQILTPSEAGIVVPEVPHSVEPDGPVRFHVEFHRAP